MAEGISRQRLIYFSRNGRGKLCRLVFTNLKHKPESFVKFYRLLVCTVQGNIKTNENKELLYTVL